MSSLQSQDGRTPEGGLGTKWSMKGKTTAEETQEEEEEEDKEEVVEAEAEVAEEMTTKKTEGWNHLEQVEVASEEMRGGETYMMITRATQEDMKIEKIQEGGDMKMRDSMENTVIETTIEAKKKTGIEDIMRTEIEIMEEAIHIGMEAARGNEVLARRLLAIGGLPQAYPWLQSTREIW